MRRKKTRRRQFSRLKLNPLQVERLERRLLLTGIDASSVGITLLDTPIEVGPGVTIIGYGPPPSAPIASNLSSAQTIHVDQLRPNGNLGLGLTGDGITFGVWDESRVRVTHQEFQRDGGGSRVTPGDNSTVALSDHSTHVAGTIGANAKSEEPG